MTATCPPTLILLEGIASESPQPPRATPADASVLTLHPLDLGITRGDGIFESIGVINGQPLELHAHLRRLARSAEMLELPVLRLELIVDGIAAAVASHAPVEELLVKVFVTRGTEHHPQPTAWIYAAENPDYSQIRKSGIAVVSLNRGYPRDIAQVAPWLLQGAKTLSYAVNRSALREGASRGAGDVIFLSSDGFVLEGPASTVILRDNGGYRTPPAEDGVLPGTTQARIFKELEAVGLKTATEPVREDELRKAEAVWLVSSGRMVVPVHTLDGVSLGMDVPTTDLMMAALMPPSVKLRNPHSLVSGASGPQAFSTK